jgi:hypothetical protein
MEINLTDEEWMSIIDGTRDGLPICCANVSALRDAIIDIARNGNDPDSIHTGLFRRAFTWVYPAHELDKDGPVVKLARQLGVDIEKLEQQDHEVQHTEY